MSASRKRQLFALLAALAAILLVASPTTARAQEEEDAPIPYPDEVDEAPRDDRGLRELPRRSDESADLREEADWETEEREQSLSRLDDPNLGIGGEVLAGVLLVEDSAGRGVLPRFAWGLRFNWEFGRLIPADPFHEALFADVTWAYGAQRDGTARIFGDTHYHYFTVAPAYEVHVGGGYDYGFYGQLGGGMAYQFAGIQPDGTETTIAGLKPVLQYGVGFRGRPLINAENNVRLAFRLELTRLHRSYMVDTLCALNVGASF